MNLLDIRNLYDPGYASRPQDIKKKNRTCKKCKVIYDNIPPEQRLCIKCWYAELLKKEGTQ
jgi:hypothetical protein